MRKSLFLGFIVALLLNSSCTSTKLTSTWHVPNKKIKIERLNKILVVALFQNETSRRTAEDQMIGYLDGKGVVSYEYLNKTVSVENENMIRDKIKKDGFDGALTMRLLDIDKEEFYSRGKKFNYPMYYGRFSAYYLRNYGYYSNPDYYSTTKAYIVETNVFSIKQDKIIWTGVTKTIDPDDVSKMTEEISKIVYEKMIKEGFIHKTPMK